MKVYMQAREESGETVEEQGKKQRKWPGPLQIGFEFFVMGAVVLAYLGLIYLDFYKGQVRGPFAVPRYYKLGEFKGYGPIGGKFDLNKLGKKGEHNFDVSNLFPAPGKKVPSVEKKVTVSSPPADTQGGKKP